MNSSIASKLSILGKWGGRLAALLLFLFWGAFFIEHLTGWFLSGGSRSLPPQVWVGQILHFAMLAGLGMMLKWDKPGALVMAISTAAFFAWIHPHTFPLIALINLVPVGCFAVYWLVRDRANTLP